jgi:energy-coupling factor transporter transmembrane protein EcfT
VSTPRTSASLADVHVLRYVPVESVVHRLWAGTKLLAVVALSVVTWFRPTWVAIALIGALIAGAVVAAHIPRGAVPRVPRALVILFLIGAPLSMLSTRPPHVDLFVVTLSLGALEQWLRFSALGLVLLASVTLVGWTTPLSELAPALRRLLRPGAVLRLPVDDIATVTALCARCLPLLVDEIRILFAARRLRPQVHYRSRRARFGALVREPVDLLVAAITVSLRRAGEMADAMDARGGTATPSDAPGPGARDVWALALVVAVAAAAIAIPI